MFEIALVARPRREQDDERWFAVGRCQTRKTVKQRAEEVRQGLNLELAEGVRKGLGEDDPVLKAISRTCRALGVIGDGPPLAVWPAGDVDGVGVQEHIARGADADTWPFETGLTEHQCGGQQTFGKQVLRAVEVAEHGIEHRCALSHC